MWKELGKHAVCRICNQELLFHLSRDLKKKRIQGDECTSGDASRRGLPTERFDGAAIESASVKQTLTETKRLTRAKYPKRCKVKHQI